MKLSDGEKLIVTMLSDIHEHLKIKNSLDPKFVKSALCSGNSWGLKWQYPGIFSGEDTPEAVVKEVAEIFAMWELLEEAHDNLSDEDKARIAAQAAPFGSRVQFRGFDGNNESGHLGAARFMIEELGRFSSFKGREMNSHMPSIDMYRRMLDAFRPIRASLDQGALTAAQIVEVLKAMTHPDSRK